MACIFRVSPIETSCEKHNHPVDDDKKNTDPVHSGLAGSVYIFTEINILITAAVKLEA